MQQTAGEQLGFLFHAMLQAHPTLPPQLTLPALPTAVGAQKGKLLDLGTPLRFANIGRTDKLELTTGVWLPNGVWQQLSGVWQQQSMVMQHAAGQPTGAVEADCCKRRQQKQKG